MTFKRDDKISMKKVIMALGYLFLVLLLFLIAATAFVAIKGRNLDKESQAFVDSAIPAIISTWDVTEVEKRASPEFNDAVDYDDLDELFGLLQRLGDLKEYRGSIGNANLTISFRYGYEITADYVANAEFETGEMEIQMTLILHGGQWQILDLTIIPAEYRIRNDII
jgi:hypothetical protein